MYELADIVVQGRIVSDTVYEANGWVYTSYVIEPCGPGKGYTADKGKPLAITRMGGDLNGVTYSRPHGIDIGYHVVGTFFLALAEEDETTPAGLLSVVPICHEGGIARYLRDDWVPVVQFGEDLLSADGFRTAMNGLFPFEYCEPILSRHVLRPVASASDDSLSLRLDVAYSSQTQDPIETLSLKLDLGSASAPSVLSRLSIWNETGEAISVSVQGDHELKVDIEVDTFSQYLDGPTTVATLSYPKEYLSDLANIKFSDGGSVAPGVGVSDFERVVIDEEDDVTRQLLRAPRIISTTAEVVGGIRQAVDMPGTAAAQRLGILCVVGTDLGNYTPTELRQKVPLTVRVEMFRESDSPNNRTTITPLPDDNITWTDNLIEIYVPTFGYFDGGNSTTIPAGAGAFPGRVRVVNDSGNDRSPNSTNVFYNQRSQASIDPGRMDTSSDDISVRKSSIVLQPETESTADGLIFVIRQTFIDNLYFGPSSLGKAKQDLCRAAAHWTKVSGIAIEFVDQCPPGINCSIVTSRSVEINSQNTEALAAGISFSDLRGCTPNEPTISGAELRFSNEKKWAPTELHLPGITTPIYEIAVHEIGHILQLNHVESSSEIMRRFTNLGIPLVDPLTPAAVAGGTHVGNVSRSVSCANTPVKYEVGVSCGTTSLGEASLQGASITYDAASATASVIIAPAFVGPETYITVHDITGRQLQRFSVNQEATVVSLAPFPSGVYVVLVSSGTASLQQLLPKF